MRHLFFVLLLLFPVLLSAQGYQKAMPLSLHSLYRTPVPNASEVPDPPEKTKSTNQLPAWAQNRPAVADTVKPGSNDICCTGCITGEIKVNLMFDNRQSLFLGQWTRMNGLRIGLELMHTVRFGMAFYNQAGETNITELIDDAEGRQRRLAYNYTTVYWEYILYRDWRYEASIPINIGLGRGRVDSLGINATEWVEERRDDAFVSSLGVNGSMKLIPWFGVGAAVGYRQLATSQRAVRRVYSAPFYAVKLKIYLGELFKTLFAKEKMQAERQAYRDEKAARQRQRNQ